MGERDQSVGLKSFLVCASTRRKAALSETLQLSIKILCFLSPDYITTDSSLCSWHYTHQIMMEQHLTTAFAWLGPTLNATTVRFSVDVILIKKASLTQSDTASSSITLSTATKEATSICPTHMLFPSRNYTRFSYCMLLLNRIRTLEDNCCRSRIGTG